MGRIMRGGKKRWNSFLLPLKLPYVLTESCPINPNSGVQPDQADLITDKIVKWINDDYFCRNHILNGMINSLYNQYSKQM